ncbi:MAG: ribbon-helix-helix protein, CopG family [Propionibacteriales bacterium]|nr:ribbon-helix-helix protein, CopG family [Propionibacteriales bacterium]
MKTAISIPADLFRSTEDLAIKLGKSRSQLYREALAEYLLRRDAQW